MRVDDDPVQSATGALACMYVSETEVGDDFDEKFVGEREDVWKEHWFYVEYVRIVNCETGRINITLRESASLKTGDEAMGPMK